MSRASDFLESMNEGNAIEKALAGVLPIGKAYMKQLEQATKANDVEKVKQALEQLVPLFNDALKHSSVKAALGIE